MIGHPFLLLYKDASGTAVSPWTRGETTPRPAPFGFVFRFAHVGKRTTASKTNLVIYITHLSSDAHIQLSSAHSEWRRKAQRPHRERRRSHKRHSACVTPVPHLMLAPLAPRRLPQRGRGGRARVLQTSGSRALMRRARAWCAAGRLAGRRTATRPSARGGATPKSRSAADAASGMSKHGYTSSE